MASESKTKLSYNLAPEEVKETLRIPVVPLGEVLPTVLGDEIVFDRALIDDIIASYQIIRKGYIPKLDAGHALVPGVPASPSEMISYGDIVDMGFDPDAVIVDNKGRERKGWLWEEIRFTPKGLEAVRNRELTHLSIALVQGKDNPFLPDEDKGRFKWSFYNTALTPIPKSSAPSIVADAKQRDVNMIICEASKNIVKGGQSMNEGLRKIIEEPKEVFGDFDGCVQTLEGKVTDPQRVCGWIWQKAKKTGGCGGSVKIIGQVKDEDLTPEELEFAKAYVEKLEKLGGAMELEELKGVLKDYVPEDKLDECAGKILELVKAKEAEKLAPEKVAEEKAEEPETAEETASVKASAKDLSPDAIRRWAIKATQEELDRQRNLDRLIASVRDFGGSRKPSPAFIQEFERNAYAMYRVAGLEGVKMLLASVKSAFEAGASVPVETQSADSVKTNQQEPEREPANAEEAIEQIVQREKCSYAEAIKKYAMKTRR
jgi:hypothetical protein